MFCSKLSLQSWFISGIGRTQQIIFLFFFIIPLYFSVPKEMQEEYKAVKAIFKNESTCIREKMYSSFKLINPTGPPINPLSGITSRNRTCHVIGHAPLSDLSSIAEDYNGLAQLVTAPEQCKRCMCCSNCSRACGCLSGEEWEEDSDMELRVLGIVNNQSVKHAEESRAKFVREEEKLFGEEEVQDEEGEDEDEGDEEDGVEEDTV